MTREGDPEEAFWRNAVTNSTAANLAHSVARKFSNQILLEMCHIVEKFTAKTLQEAQGTSSQTTSATTVTTTTTTTSTPATSVMPMPPLVLPPFQQHPSYPGVPQQWGYGGYPSAVPPQPMLQQPLQVPRPPTPVLPTGRSTPNVMDTSFMRALDTLHTTPAPSPSPLHTPTTEENRD